MRAILLMLVVLCAGCESRPEAKEDAQEVESVRGQILCSLSGKAFTHDIWKSHYLARVRSADKLCTKLVDAELPPS